MVAGQEIPFVVAALDECVGRVAVLRRDAPKPKYSLLFAIQLPLEVTIIESGKVNHIE